mmetsp:Transcript_119972/g.195214  ORF Transcript_119972/g.195214 Transcript_119972/m.195214 type:complete len:93 (-) Transcript_119972:766-1044(-)
MYLEQPDICTAAQEIETSGPHNVWEKYLGMRTFFLISVALAAANSSAVVPMLLSFFLCTSTSKMSIRLAEDDFARQGKISHSAPSMSILRIT